MREEAAGGREEERAQESGWVAVQFLFLAINSSNEPWPLLDLLRIAGRQPCEKSNFCNVSYFYSVKGWFESRAFYPMLLFATLSPASER